MNAKLYDLTEINVWREMKRKADDPLADPTFRRHVAEVKTEDQRARQVERLRKARRAA